MPNNRLLQEFPQAIDKLERTLKIKHQVLGEYHPDLAKTLNALGAVYAVQNEKAKAMECFQQALLIVRANARDGNERDPSVMLALRNIAILKGEKVKQWSSDDSQSP